MRRGEIQFNYYVRPASAYNGLARADMPVPVHSHRRKTKPIATAGGGSLHCAGPVFIRTHNGMVRIA
jgi:hypothetical protein